MVYSRTKKKQQEMRLTDFQIVNALNFIHIGIMIQNSKVECLCKKGPS